MRSLYLRIWLTVVAVLALFALVSGFLLQRHFDQQRDRAEGSVQSRVELGRPVYLPPVVAGGMLCARGITVARMVEVLAALSRAELAYRRRSMV